MPVERATPDELARLTRLIDRWATRELVESPIVTAVEQHAAERRWLLRLRGEEKSVITVWLTLRERTVQYETYVMPAPEENAEQLYEYLLRANARLFGMRFALGDEDAVYLVGQMPIGAVDEDELDRVVGASYAYTEQYFRPAMSIGYATAFGRK